MYLTEVDLSFTEVLTPYLPLIGTVAGGLVVGAFAIWNRRKGNVETKTPTVTELWAREERVYRHARRLERYVDLIIDAFRGYHRRVSSGGSVEPTPEESIALSAEPPTIGDD